MELTEKVYKFMSHDLIVLEDTAYYESAMSYMKSYCPERIPFFDCVYMSLMEDIGINEILSFDEHFDLNKNIKRIF